VFGKKVEAQPVTMHIDDLIARIKLRPEGLMGPTPEFLRFWSS